MKKKLILATLVTTGVLTIGGISYGLSRPGKPTPVANTKTIQTIPTTPTNTEDTQPVSTVQTTTPTTTSEPTPITTQPEQPTNPFSQGFGTWYVFNKRTEVGKTMPSVASVAAPYCYQVDKSLFSTTPQQYAIACSGTIVAFVEQVNTDGSIWISTMNATGQASITDTTPVSGWNRVSFSLIQADALATYKFID